jgi:hypothetical protein
MSKITNKAKQINSFPEKRKSKSYVVVHGISGAFCLIAAIALLIAMLTQDILVFIFPVLLGLFLGIIELASVRAVQKHGVKVMPRQIIFPIVKLWKDNGIDPAETNKPLERTSKRH